MEELIEHFVIDSNSLINLNSYSKEVFPSLWNNFHEMVNNGEIISVTEVQAELSGSHGPVKDYWEKIDKNMKDMDFFWDLYDEEIECLSRLEDFKEFQKAGETKSYFADPHLIAMAMSQGFIVLTDERRIDNPKSIPYVCRQVDVMYMNLTEFMVHQGWKW